MKKTVFALFLFISVFMIFTAFGAREVRAAGLTPVIVSVSAVSVGPAPLINLSIGGDDQQQTATALQALLLLSVIALAPSILLMMTCFPRFLISLHFLRSALGTQQMPPNQILISLALFLSVFLMRNELNDINELALKPFSSGYITQEVAVGRAMEPIRAFMFRYVEQNDIDLFSNMAGVRYDKNDPETIPNTVLIPAFMIGELAKGFKIGVIIYFPFIVIDMVVASTLMAMGMMMLPPAMISLPFKIILFVLVDGWNLVIKQIFAAFLRS